MRDYHFLRGEQGSRGSREAQGAGTEQTLLWCGRHLGILWRRKKLGGPSKNTSGRVSGTSAALEIHRISGL